jgi:pimeloyl-ACP methyl ester carboxylesterase
MRNVISIICIGIALLATNGCAKAQEQVSFLTWDGITIHGDWYAAKDASIRVLILLHMNRSDRSHWKDFASIASPQNFYVLAIDLRGHGESTESTSGPIHFDSLADDDYTNMALDVDAAVEWVRSQANLKSASIGIIGASIGANVALNYAANHPQIAAIILLSP